MKMRIPTNEEYSELARLTGGDDKKMHWKDIFSWVDDKAHEYDLPPTFRVYRGYPTGGCYYSNSATNRHTDVGFRPAFDILPTDTLLPDINAGDVVTVGALYMNGKPVKVPQNPKPDGDILSYIPGATLELKKAPLVDQECQMTGIYIGNGVIVADRVMLNYISHQDIEANTVTPILTHSMVEKGYDEGHIKLIKSPNGDGIVCQIGDNWLYLCDKEAENYYNPKAYIAASSKSDIIDCIYDTLMQFGKSKEFYDEFLYYVTFLSEKLKLPIPREIFQYQKTVIAYIDNGPADKLALGIVVKTVVPDSDPISAIKAAAQEYCETPEGKTFLANSLGDFNYGDFVEANPEELCKKHGFYIVDTFTTESVVRHDEKLYQ